jgi:hypothetical protein
LNQFEVGKQWIKHKLHEVAQECGVSLGGSQWRETTDDFDHLQLSLVYEISGTEHIEKFSRSEIDDSAADPAVQARLENRIRKLLGSFSPRPRRIGF